MDELSWLLVALPPLPPPREWSRDSLSDAAFLLLVWPLRVPTPAAAAAAAPGAAQEGATGIDDGVKAVEWAALRRLPREEGLSAVAITRGDELGIDGPAPGLGGPRRVCPGDEKAWRSSLYLSAAFSVARRDASSAFSLAAAWMYAFWERGESMRERGDARGRSIGERGVALGVQ